MEVHARVSLYEMEFVSLPNSGEALYWSGIEVKIGRAELDNALAKLVPLPAYTPGRYWIAASLLPRSYRWYTEAPLLPGMPRLNPAWKPEMQAVWAGERQIADLAFDPFEQDDGFLVARLGDLLRTDWLLETPAGSDAFYDSASVNRRSRAKREWSFALCPAPPRDVVRALKQQFSDVTVDGTMDNYRPPRVSAKTGAASKPNLDYRERTELQVRHTFQLLQADADRCPEVAIYQSLARREGSEAALRGRILTDYREHFRNMDYRIVKSKEDLCGVFAQSFPELATNARRAEDKFKEYATAFFEQRPEFAADPDSYPAIAAFDAFLKAARRLE